MTTVDPPVGTPIAADNESAPASSEVQQSESASVLITEQQVRFSTSAAIAPPATRGWNPFQAVGAAVGAVFARSDKPKPRRHYPRRPAFIEDAAMAREMDRL